VTGPSQRTEDLRQLEETSALGYLYNAIAHELNNQLTNLLLAADQFSGSQSAKTLDIMVGQAQKMGEVVRRLQELGGANMDRGSDQVSLSELCDDLSAWLVQLDPASEFQFELVDPDAQVVVHRSNLVRALCFLAQWGGEMQREHPLRVRASLEQLPRSSWAPAGETITMAVLRIRRGNPPSEANPLLKSVVDDFFAATRSKDEVELMAAWEIVRKLRGRLQLFGGPGHPGVEWVLALQAPE